ncbi:hypothetical protein Q9L58_008340 [Maublancomyces gigas]|uniref:Uncharacterized protein n=1 Tax=Discina gigas TaxID=1032678 RepID=A0ABR3G9X3_9PEZI
MATQQPDFDVIASHFNGLRREMLLLPNVSRNDGEVVTTLQRVQHQIQEMHDHIQDQAQQSQVQSQAQMDQIRAQMDQMQNQLQRRMQLVWEEMRVMRDQMKEARDQQQEARALQMEQGLIAMRLYNSAPGNYATPVQFPPGMNCNDLPKTRADLMRLTQSQYQMLAKTLGLPPAPVFPSTESCRQVADYLGVRL